MAPENFSTFQSGEPELHPVLNLGKSARSQQVPISFTNSESQGSIASSENDSMFSKGDVASSESSTTATTPTGATEKTSNRTAAVQNIPTPTIASKKMVKVKFKLVVHDKLLREYSTITQDDQAFDLYRANGSDDTGPDIDGESQPEILKIITEASGFDKQRRKTNFEKNLRTLDEVIGPPSPPSPPGIVKRLRALKFEDLSVTEIGETRMEIHSRTLLEAIRKVVDYYPSQNLSGDIVIIYEPYWVLIHHEHHLRTLYDEISSPSQERSPADKEAAEHLRILLEFMKPQVEKIVPPIQKLLQNSAPTITFDALWYLLKPGTLAYCQYDGEWIGCVIMGVKGKQRDISSKIHYWNVRVWFLGYDVKGLWRGYTKSSKEPEIKTKHSIEWYEGERDVTSLEVVPREYWDAIDNGERRAKFEARGAKKVKLMSTRFRQMSHKGESLERKRRPV